MADTSTPALLLSKKDPVFSSGIETKSLLEERSLECEYTALIGRVLKSTDSFHPLYCSMSQQHMALVTLPLPQTGCLSDTASSPWPSSPGQVLLSPLQAHSSIWSWGSGGLGLSQVLLLSWWWWFSCQVVSDSCDPMEAGIGFWR